MSEDIERLKKVLEDMRVSNDTLAGQMEVMGDVFAAVTHISPYDDEEGYHALVDVAKEFQPEFHRLVKAMFDAHISIASIHAKVVQA